MLCAKQACLLAVAGADGRRLGGGRGEVSLGLGRRRPRGVYMPDEDGQGNAGAREKTGVTAHG
jgi:hypothetical protein